MTDTGVGSDRAAPVVILGGSNIVADRVMKRLAEAERVALVVARRCVPAPAGFGSLRLDILDAGRWRSPPGAAILSILPLAVLVEALPLLDQAGSIVAVGSTSLFSKAASPDAGDQAAAASLAASEGALQAFCEGRGIPWTVLRPTLVYDGLGDRNVARLAGTIRRLGALPVISPASGLRQPIHADDVALAVLAAQHNMQAQDRAFNIAGGEVLSYRMMVERIFAAMGRKPRILPIPGWAIDAAFRIPPLAVSLKARGLSHTLFQRMNEDLVFDVAPGREILGLRPRPFTLPDLRRA